MRMLFGFGVGVVVVVVIVANQLHRAIFHLSLIALSSSSSKMVVSQ